LARSAEPFRIFPVDEELVGQTLAAGLKKLIECKSWGDAKKVVAQRRVQLNGNLCMDPARRLTDRDVIKVWNEPLPKPIDETALRLVHVDDDLIVVDKPPRVTSARHFEERNMPKRRRQLQPTLEELMPLALAKYLRKHRAKSQREQEDSNDVESVRRPMIYRNAAREEEAAKQYASKLRVVAVHRLDRDTSGLMLFARHRRAAERLGKLFRAHAVDRRYQAVVIGATEAQTFDSYLIRDRGDGHRGVASDPIPEDAQRAITHIRPIERIGDYTIIECKLETGRTHQIRIHLAEAGHPLCGETIYQRAANGEIIRPDLSHAPRQALHSSALRFAHPMTGEVLRFQSAWPGDLQRWLDKLRSENRKA
jgi:23S rRNA pseudouridine1911/1915/1917 synthase